MIKGKSTDGPISRYLNRRLSTRITEAIIKSGINLTPNQVSVISFIITSLSLPAYSLGIAWLAGILIQAGSVIDGVDGELARAKGISSPRGAFIDSMLDRFADILAYVGAAAYVINYEVGHTPLIPNQSVLTTASVYAILMLALSSDLLVSYLHSKAPELLKVHPALIGRLPMIASRDVRLFILFVASIPGLVLEGLITITILSFTYIVIKFLEIIITTKQ